MRRTACARRFLPAMICVGTWEGGPCRHRRRDLVALLGSAAGAWPLAAWAQQPERLRRIGILRFTNQDQAVINSLLRGLQILGYSDGKNVAIEYRDAEGNYERFSNEVSELVKLNPDVIFSFAANKRRSLRQQHRQFRLW